MIFNRHSRYEGQHAFLGPSRYHWINYDNAKLDQAYDRWLAVQRGTQLHAFAAQAIRLGIELPDNGSTLSMYVNDAIAYGLVPEQVLYFSDNAFGTADAIGFNNDFLRIHDLKTGASPTSLHQLEIYMALFCLEYSVDPTQIQAELRIYQGDAVNSCVPDPQEILRIMDKIVTFDERIELLKGG